MNNKFDPSIDKRLMQLPQVLPAQDGFDVIMDQVHQQKRQHSFRVPAIAASLMAVFIFWQLIQPTELTLKNTEQLQQLSLLNEKIAMIEHVVRNEVINHSEPGSPILEKMISMENWLDQLDINIAQTDEASQKIELMHAKLEILDDLVALHKQYKPQASQLVI